MGELTRNFDWSQTPVGAPDQWPQSLRTTVSNLLRSKFPMFLWWGKDMIQFYNDAYRPSLGNNGKHPHAIGQKGKECWPEIWDIISPLHQQVQTTGEATWMEDQLVPIYRNGKLEDVYWTYSYSSVLDDNGVHAGILVTCSETTEQVMNLKKMEESKEALRFAIEAAELGTWDYNPITNQFSGNDRLKEWFGLSVEKEMDLQLAINIIAEADKQRVFEAIQKALQHETGGLYDIEYTIVHAVTGKERIVRAKGRAWFGKNQQCYRFNGTLQDVTDQVMARNKMEESTQKIKAIIESAPFPIGVYIGREMKIEFVNQSIIQVWGKGDNIIGQRYADVLPELENQRIYAQLDGVYTTGIPFHARNQRVDLAINGQLKPFYFNYSFTPLFDAAGKVYGVMNTAAEVTDLNEAKQQVEQREKVFRSMILQAPVAMCIFRGHDFVIEIANEKMFELWGKSSAEVMNKPVFDALPEVRNQGYEAILHHVLATGESFSASELPITLPRNGRVQNVFINFAYEPLLEANGTISGIMAVAIDVTEQVAARQKIEEVVALRTMELAKANEELKRSNANLEEFAHAASHDLKEPIRKIHFFTQQLKEQLLTHLKESEVRLFNRIENASQRMGNLIDDLLLYSHVSQRPHETEQVHLAQAIEHVLEDLELDIQEKSALITIERLPVVQGHRRQLQQLFQNLISNALKYSKAEVTPCITIAATTTTENNHPFHVIVVEDNGIGFEQHYEEKIFQMFSRLHGKAEYSGTGVGLSIAKKVVENHNGFIRVESTPGEGATFKVYLPVE